MTKEYDDVMRTETKRQRMQVITKPELLRVRVFANKYPKTYDKIVDYVETYVKV